MFTPAEIREALADFSDARIEAERIFEVVRDAERRHNGGRTFSYDDQFLAALIAVLKERS